MSGLVLVVRLGGERVAFRADAVSSVVEIDDNAPVPRAAPHVAGLAALRSRVLTVVDTYRAIGLPRPGDEGREAVIVELHGHAYALMVDRVDDVVEATEDPPCGTVPMTAGWARVAAGTVKADGDLLVLVDAAALIADPRAAAA